MKAARIVVLTVAVAAGGIAALLAGRSEKAPEPKAEAPKFDTVDILVAKSDVSARSDADSGGCLLAGLARNDGQRQFYPQD